MASVVTVRKFIPHALIGCVAMTLLAKHRSFLYSVHWRRQTAADVDVTQPHRLFLARFMFGRTRSRLLGALSETYVPPSLRSFVLGMFARAVGVDLSEVRYDLTHYKSLQEFFMRPLKEGVRPIDEAAAMVSPVDSRLMSCGELPVPGVGCIPEPSRSLASTSAASIATTAGSPPSRGAHSVGHSDDDLEELSKARAPVRIPMIKHATYNVDGFVGRVLPPASPGKKWMYCVLYLCPAAYHRVHCPADGFAVQRGVHFHGECLPLFPPLLERLNDLFSVQERLVLDGRWAHGELLLTFVAAYNVGNIWLEWDKSLMTNCSRRFPSYLNSGIKAVKRFDDGTFGADGIVRNRGDLLGGFKLGSTVVLTFEAPMDYEFVVPVGETVHVGEPLVQAAAQGSTKLSSS